MTIQESKSAIYATNIFSNVYPCGSPSYFLIVYQIVSNGTCSLVIIELAACVNRLLKRYVINIYTRTKLGY